jgi:hypothetical protein
MSGAVETVETFFQSFIPKLLLGWRHGGHIQLQCGRGQQKRGYKVWENVDDHPVWEWLYWAGTSLCGSGCTGLVPHCGEWLYWASTPLLLKGHGMYVQIMRYFIECYGQRSRPEEQLVQIARLLILPMVNAGFDADEKIVDEEMLALVVSSMFDPPEDLAGTPHPTCLPPCLLMMRTFLHVRHLRSLWC